jgi:signal transduction histidine kinase
VSHELRTPLSPIKGWASTLLQFGDTLEPHERRSAIQSILRQSQRLERLIVNLLEVSQIEHGVLGGTDVDVDVNAVVERVVGDFHAASPDRNLVVTCAAGAWARGRELWVEQILSNLVSNAVKYSPDTEPVEIAIGACRDRVSVTVADRGCGIPSHEQDRVFERFHRVRETTTQAGTGLGLYIARQLAGEMEGTISVASVPGHGSTFTLELPAAAHVLDVRSAPHAIGLEAG